MGQQEKRLRLTGLWQYPKPISLNQSWMELLELGKGYRFKTILL